MAVQLTTAGNFLARTRRTEPTGEKHRITWTQGTAGPLRGPAVPRPIALGPTAPRPTAPRPTAPLGRALAQPETLRVVSGPKVWGAHAGFGVGGLG